MEAGLEVVIVLELSESAGVMVITGLGWTGFVVLFELDIIGKWMLWEMDIVYNFNLVMVTVMIKIELKFSGDFGFVDLNFGLIFSLLLISI